MLTIFFDLSFDHGCWPGPLAHTDATVGEIWAGPSKLLELVETFTGLRAPVVPHTQRIAAIIPSMFACNGFWSQSAQVDPFGSARKLLEWRDYLWLHGWRGQACGHQRIDALATVTANALPGLVDRVIQTIDAIESTNNTIAKLSLWQPKSALPKIWRRLIDKLQSAGTRIHEISIAPASAKGDLQAYQNGCFNFQGDGSLQLLRPKSCGEAAQEVAAWLSRLDDWRHTVIIGADTCLDAALHRFGLPTTGAGMSGHDHALLQILPLILAAAHTPADPQQVMALLMLPICPIPKSLQRRLLRAMQKYPAVDSDDWRQALKDGLNDIEDTDRRRRVKQRLDMIFSGAIDADNYPAPEILARIGMLRSWAIGRMQTIQYKVNWQPLMAQLENTDRMVRLSRMLQFSGPQIRRLIADSISGSQALPMYPAQAGLANVGAPESILGPADHIVWWPFNRDAAQTAYADPFTPAERSALAKIGVALPAPGDQAVLYADKSRRPFFYAHKHLILVCPEIDRHGEPQYPHPVWDELIGRVAHAATVDRIQHDRLIAGSKSRKIARRPARLPAPIDALAVDAGIIPKRPYESANSLSALISCPFRWILTYAGKVSGGLTPAPAAPETLEGWFIHEILRRLLDQGAQSPSQAAQNAVSLFDKCGPRLAAAFFMPGQDGLRARVRLQVERTASQLFQIIGKGQFSIGDVEQSIESNLSSLGFTLNGRPDLILESPVAIIDFKRGGMRYRRSELESGTGIQLAVYARLLKSRNGGRFPPAAYFLIREGQLISLDDAGFPDAVRIAGPRLEDTWKAICASYQAIRSDLDKGRVCIPGNDAAPTDANALTDKSIQLKPCAFCDFGVLCGQAFKEDDR